MNRSLRISFVLLAMLASSGCTVLHHADGSRYRVWNLAGDEHEDYEKGMDYSAALQKHCGAYQWTTDSIAQNIRVADSADIASMIRQKESILFTLWNSCPQVNPSLLRFSELCRRNGVKTMILGTDFRLQDKLSWLCRFKMANHFAFLSPKDYGNPVVKKMINFYKMHAPAMYRRLRDDVENYNAVLFVKGSPVKWYPLSAIQDSAGAYRALGEINKLRQ